eukprot:gene13118-17583_t
MRRCVSEGWKSYAGHLLAPEEVNLYTVNEKIIKPYTEARKCSFVELLTNDPQSPYLFDIYTAHGREGPVGISDGYCDADISQAYGYESRPLENKNKRESSFPIHILQNAFKFDIRSAKATKEIDLIRIKNSIADVRPINKNPAFDNHPNYDILNNSLRGKIIVPGLDKLLKDNNMIDCLKILKNSYETNLILHNLKHSQPPFNDEMAKLLSNSIPKTMKTIDINLNDCPIGPEGIAAIFSIPSKSQNSKSQNLTNITLKNNAENEVNKAVTSLSKDKVNDANNNTDSDSSLLLSEKIINSESTFNHFTTDSILNPNPVNLHHIPTEERGITLAQLRFVYNEIMRRCVSEGWKDYAGHLVAPEEVNLYIVYEKIIEPYTEARKCSFVELLTNDPQSPYLFDIYTSHGENGDAVGISDGYCDADIRDAHGYDPALFHYKNVRESSFPIHILQKLFNFDIRTALASQEIDRIHIMNAITNQPLDMIPVENHPTYDLFNNALRGKMIILKNSYETNLILHNLKHSQPPFNDEMAKLLSNSIPKTMKTIDINLNDCPIGPEGIAAIFSIPSKSQNLTKITIYCSEYGIEAALALSESLISNQNELTTIKLYTNNFKLNL